MGDFVSGHTPGLEVTKLNSSPVQCDSGLGGLVQHKSGLD